MTESVWIALISGVFGSGGVAIVTAILNYRSKMRNSSEPPVTTTEAAQAAAVQAVEATGAPTVTRETLTVALNALQREMQAEIDVIAAKLDRNTRELSAMTGYVWSLREQIARLGHEPLPWPDELKERTSPAYYDLNN